MIDIDALLPEPEQLRWRGHDYTIRKGVPLSILKAAGQDDADTTALTVALIAHALGITVADLEAMEPTDQELTALQAAVSSGTDELGGSSASSDSSQSGDDPSRPTSPASTT